MRGRRDLLLLAGGALGLLTACGNASSGYEAGSCESPPPVVSVGEPMRLVTSVAPLTDIVAVVAAGTDTIVDGVVPAGVDSHTFEPSPGVARAIEAADGVILNGLGLEQPTLRLARANLRDGSPICLLGDEVLPPAEYRFDAAFPESGGVPNPHLWTNPASVGSYVEVLARWLSAADPENADRYRANASAFTIEIEALSAATAAAVATISPERRHLVTYHDAYAYFAESFGLEVIGAVQPSSFDEPTPRDVARLVEQIERTGVDVIFGSEVFPSPVLEQLANETGVAYVDDLRDDVLPGSPGTPEHSWLGMMRFNITTIVEALGGDAAALEDVQS